MDRIASGKDILLTLVFHPVWCLHKAREFGFTFSKLKDVERFYSLTEDLYKTNIRFKTWANNFSASVSSIDKTLLAFAWSTTGIKHLKDLPYVSRLFFHTSTWERFHSLKDYQNLEDPKYWLFGLQIAQLVGGLKQIRSALADSIVSRYRISSDSSHTSTASSVGTTVSNLSLFDKSTTSIVEIEDQALTPVNEEDLEEEKSDLVYDKLFGGPNYIPFESKMAEDQEAIKDFFKTIDQSKPEKIRSNLSVTDLRSNTGKEKDAFYTSVKSLIDNDNVFNQVLDSVAYQGFDPEVIRALIERTWPVAVERAHNVFFMIVLFLARGSSIVEKAKVSTLKSATAERVNKLVEALDLHKNVKEANKKASTSIIMTLPRICNSYPDIAWRVLAKPNLVRPIDIDDMVSDGFFSFPPVFRGGFIFSIMPKLTKDWGALSTSKEAIIKAILHYQIKEHILLNKNAKQTHEILKNCTTFATAAFDSKALNAAERINQWRAIVGIVGEVDFSGWTSAFNKLHPDDITIHTSF
nr:MAG: nucleoprotein [Drosophila Tranent phlebovirus]